MAKFLIIYSSTDGHTKEICLRLQQIIESQQHQVKIVSITQANTLDLNSVDKIIIGASIRYGRHSKDTYDFINKNLYILNSKPNAFFSVNVVARKSEKNTPETNPYLLKFLRQISWKPDKLGVFAGKIEYQKYKFWDRIMIRIIMWMTKGPTDPNTNIEFTDWNQVEKFGLEISKI